MQHSKVEKLRLLLLGDGDILMVKMRSTFRPKTTIVASSLVVFSCFPLANTTGGLTLH